MDPTREGRKLGQTNPTNGPESGNEGSAAADGVRAPNRARTPRTTARCLLEESIRRTGADGAAFFELRRDPARLTLVAAHGIAETARPSWRRMEMAKASASRTAARVYPIVQAALLGKPIFVPEWSPSLRKPAAERTPTRAACIPVYDGQGQVAGCLLYVFRGLDSAVPGSIVEEAFFRSALLNDLSQTIASAYFNARGARPGMNRSAEREPLQAGAGARVSPPLPFTGTSGAGRPGGDLSGPVSSSPPPPDRALAAAAAVAALCAEPMFVGDASLVRLASNRAFEALSPAAPTFFSLVNERDLPEVRRVFDAARLPRLTSGLPAWAARPPVTVSCRIRNTEGVYLPFTCRARQISVAEGDALQWVIVLTPRARRTGESRPAFKLGDAFFRGARAGGSAVVGTEHPRDEAAVFHDLRAPLGAMRLWLDVLRSGKPSRRRAAEDALRASVNAQWQLIDEIANECGQGPASLAPARRAGQDQLSGPLPARRPDVDPALADKDMSLLVVDDDELAREGLALLLEDAGVKIRMAASAEEGVSELLRLPADVVVCDLSMPCEDGYAFRERACGLLSREVSPQGIPLFVALSAHVGPEARARALSEGFAAYISKPVEPAYLLATIGALLDARRAAPECSADDARAAPESGTSRQEPARDAIE